jgi:hypothetical protein
MPNIKSKKYTKIFQLKHKTYKYSLKPISDNPLFNQNNNPKLLTCNDLSLNTEESKSFNPKIINSGTTPIYRPKKMKLHIDPVIWLCLLRF